MRRRITHDTDLSCSLSARYPLYTAADAGEHVEALRVCPDVGGRVVVNRCLTMAITQERPRVAVFGPDLLLSITIEARSHGEDVHVHSAGQGAWVARMAAELGAYPILCSLVGGETGAVTRDCSTRSRASVA